MTVTGARSGLLPARGATGGRPIYLDLDRSTTLVFLHEPAERSASAHTAVLLCPPFGWEEMCCARTLRTVAAHLASAGYPTARLSLPGTGDGSGGPRQADLLTAWVEAVGGAAGWLRQRTRASRCVAFGIGLGGILAYLAAAEHDAVDDLILWAVPDQGRVLLRESKGLSKVIASDFPEDQGHDPAAAGDLELIGYLMTSETQAALSELRLSGLPLPGSQRRRVLLLSRGALRADEPLQESLESRGADVEVLRTTDYYGLMVKPEQSQPPIGTVANVLRWLAQGRHAARASWQTVSHVARATVHGASEMNLPNGVVERPFSCSASHGDVFGVLSQTPTDDPAPLALVFVGAGALPHTGPNRAWVELARRWAPRGVPAVRLDLAGIGEAGGEDPELVSDESTYQPWRAEDVRRVLDRLQAAGIAEQFVLGGLCSGANCSLQCALADSRVVGVLLINLFLVTWSSELVAERGQRAAAGNRPSPAERRQLGNAIGTFDVLSERGTDVLMLFGQQEALYDEFAHYGVVDELGRWPNIRFERIPSRDQMFRARWLQRYVHERLDSAIEHVVARSLANARPEGERLSFRGGDDRMANARFAIPTS